MTDTTRDPPIRDEELLDSSTQSPTQASRKGKKKHISMHEGIGAWADCCSCEAEPYWREHAEEMGVDFNEYEENEFEIDESRQPVR